MFIWGVKQRIDCFHIFKFNKHIVYIKIKYVQLKNLNAKNIHVPVYRNNAGE